MLKLIEGYAWVIKLVLLGALFAGGWWLGDSLKQGEWDAARVVQQEEAARKLKAANDRADAAEIALAKKLNHVSAQYQKKLKEKDLEKDNAIASAKSNGLWVTATCDGGGQQVSDSSSTSSGHNGEARARLSEEIANALIAIASDADKVTEQLTSCQKALKNQEKIINDQQPKN